MLSVKVAGQWLGRLGAHGPVTVEYGLHGSESASWRMDPTFRHPTLRGNADVDIYDGGVPCWTGTLIEPGSSGEYHARGLWHQGERSPALDTALNFTTVPDAVTTGAFARGEITWKQYGSISNVAWATNATDMTLTQLLDGYAAENALRWSIDGTGELRMRADPTTPAWHVPHAVAGRGLTPAEDEFATHLVGAYLTAGGTYGRVTVGSTEAATHFGRRTVKVDLSFMGAIDAARATAVLNGMFLRGGARMGFGEGLELAHGQITTPGGTPATLSQIRDGQMIRLAGVVDPTRAGLLRGYTDIVTGSVRYTDGSGFISITPIGYAPRNLTEVLTLAVAG